MNERDYRRTSKATKHDNFRSQGNAFAITCKLNGRKRRISINVERGKEMKKAKMLRDKLCGLKYGDIVDIVEKDDNEYTIYKKGIDGHSGSGNKDICKNLECWWVESNDIEIIKDKPQNIEKRLYNYLLEYHSERPISMKSLADYFALTERELRKTITRMNKEMCFEFKIASRTKEPSGYYMAVSKSQQKDLILKQKVKALKELDYLKKLLNETNTNQQLSFKDNNIELERVIPFYEGS